ncbi:MAG: phage terminase small subunit P27 family [Candidatus Humimicrobiaceae bacterium]
MTIPGTKPKPVALKLLEGNPGRRKLNINEPKPAPIAPECPDWLLDDAKEEWKAMSATLERLGILTSIDKAAFAGYCQSYAKWKKAEEFIKKFGFTYKIPKKDKDGDVVSIFIAAFPEVSIARSSLEHVRQFCAEFGLTPSARGRMSLPSGKEDDDPMQKVWNKYKKRV